MIKLKGTERKKIVLVDDDPDHRLLIEDYLPEYITILTFFDKVKSVQEKFPKIAEKQEISLVVVDGELKDGSGQEVIDFLSQNFPHILIVGFSQAGRLKNVSENLQKAHGFGNLTDVILKLLRD